MNRAAPDAFGISCWLRAGMWCHRGQDFLISSVLHLSLCCQGTRTINHLSGIHQSINQKTRFCQICFTALSQTNQNLVTAQWPRVWAPRPAVSERLSVPLLQNRETQKSFHTAVPASWPHDATQLKRTDWWLTPGTKKSWPSSTARCSVCALRTTNHVLLFDDFHHSEPESYKLLTSSLLEQNTSPLSLLITISCICITVTCHTLC